MGTDSHTPDYHATASSPPSGGVPLNRRPRRTSAATTRTSGGGRQTWRVEVQGDGRFNFEGKRWRSLSAIARRITGTSRNGPAFLGLHGGDHNGAA